MRKLSLGDGYGFQYALSDFLSDAGLWVAIGFFFSSPIYGFQGPWVGLCRSGGDCLDLMGSTIINRRFCSWKSKFLSRSTRNEICLLQVYFHIFIYIYFFYVLCNLDPGCLYIYACVYNFFFLGENCAYHLDMRFFF